MQEYYLWLDQTRLSAVFDKNGNLKLYYVYGIQRNAPSYMVKNGVNYKLATDMNGTIHGVMNDNGEYVQKITYDEFGMVMTDSNPNFQVLAFSGGLYDQDTKLVRFGARDYDPSIGRWTTKDPIGFAGGDTNLYAYVGGNPTSRTDPSGLSDINLFPSYERIYNSDFLIPNMPGAFSVGGHGSSAGMVDSSKRQLTPQQVANLIKSSPGFRGQTVQLNSCSTGGATLNGEPNFAQQLSNILGTSVVAPDNILGVYTTGQTTVFGTGMWNVFSPNQVPLR